MRSRDHLSYGITQCYLPPGRGDSPDFTLAFTSTHFTVLQKVEGGVDLGTAGKVLQPVSKTVYHSGRCDKCTDGGFSPTARYASTRPLSPVYALGDYWDFVGKLYKNGPNVEVQFYGQTHVGHTKHLFIHRSLLRLGLCIKIIWGNGGRRGRTM